MKTTRQWLWMAAILLLPTLNAGCINAIGGAPVPIPVQPWVSEQIEERLVNKSDARTVVMPPIPPGHRALCEDPPDRAQILRAMPRVTRGVPYFYEEFRDDIQFTVEKLVDKVDPPRFFPLVGPAQLHHCHWKCTIYFTETVESSYPFPFHAKRRRAEVVYIDKDHLHLCVAPGDAQQAVIRDMTSVRP